MKLLVIMAKIENKIKILQVADRPGWAIDRLSKSLFEIYENIDMSYFYTKGHRYLDTGYSNKTGNTQYTPELANEYDIVHFHRAEAAKSTIKSIRKGVRKILHIHTERLSDFDGIDLNMFDDLICPTRYAFNELSKKHNKVHYVPHGVDLRKYQYEFKEPNDKAIGFVGRIIEHKRFHVWLAQ